jgi:hypothetical protein
VKLSLVRTKTLTASTADALDGAFAAFCQSLREESYLDVQFMVADGVFVAFITYTV